MVGVRWIQKSNPGQLMNVLLTGGAGYIGAHLLVDLLEEGHDVVVFDNCSTGSAEAIARAECLTGRQCTFVHADVRDAESVRGALKGIDAVIHLAGSKKVGESVAFPARYFHNNVGGMAVLLDEMERAGIHKIVYSSSAAVYGTQHQVPIAEDAPLRPDSPYGRSKLLGEHMLADLAACGTWSAVSLRYFNPVGAHPSGLIGEPLSEAASLVPRALRALLDSDDQLAIFGTDYATRDGTCLRDYVHVCDLARAHLDALSILERPGHHVYNVGTGNGCSVREVLASCERVAGRPVPALDGERRAGDVAVAVADVSKIADELGFRATRGLDDMVTSAWRWACRHPDGYTNLTPVLRLQARAAAPTSVSVDALEERTCRTG